MSHNPALLVETDADGVGMVRTSDGTVQRACAGGPCCGGSGDEDCCVCGQCFFEGVLENISGNVSVSGGGTAMNCCPVFLPGTVFCSESEIIVLRGDASYPEMESSVVACSFQAQGSIEYPHDTIDCDGSFLGDTPLRVDTSYRGISAAANACPRFILPREPGAIIQRRTNQDGERFYTVIMYGGSPALGPLVMGRTVHTFGVEPGPQLSIAHVFAVAGAGGGSGVIVTANIPCWAEPCKNGCTVGQFGFPFKVEGGASATGVFDCIGEFDVTGSFNTVVALACEVDGNDPCFDADGRIIGFRCTQTGTFSLDMNYGVDAQIASIVEQCQPSPEGGDIAPIEIDTDQIVIPQQWLDAEPELKFAHDTIKEFLSRDPDATQTPPPGAPPPLPGTDSPNPIPRRGSLVQDPATTEAVRRQLDQFRGGCCG